MRDVTEILNGEREFNPTSWTLVRAAGDGRALDSLIQLYWKPLYFFVRQHGYDNETAKDVVQDFLSLMIEREAFTRADPARGRFRTFLLTALVNFMKDRAKSASRQKRGGDRALLSLDFTRGEDEYAIEVSAGEDPERVLRRTWARALWMKALGELQGEPSHLQAFRMYLQDADYQNISESTGLTVGAAKTAIHRLKLRLREIIVDHLRATASSEEELQTEIGEFMSCLAEPRPKR